MNEKEISKKINPPLWKPGGCTKRSWRERVRAKLEESWPLLLLLIMWVIGFGYLVKLIKAVE